MTSFLQTSDREKTRDVSEWLKKREVGLRSGRFKVNTMQSPLSVNYKQSLWYDGIRKIRLTVNL